jgi:hypothetical protein
MTLLRYFGSLVLLLILYASCIFVVVPAQQPQPKPAIKPVAANLADLYEQAKTSTVAKRKDLEATAPYQAFVAAQNNEQATILYIAAKIGADPDACRPQFDDKGRLTGFECKDVKP